jgi:hypothetical protein
MLTGNKGGFVKPVNVLFPGIIQPANRLKSKPGSDAGL